MVHQHVDYVLEETRLLRTEAASLDLVHGLLQLWQTLVILSGIVPAWKEWPPGYSMH